MINDDIVYLLYNRLRNRAECSRTQTQQSIIDEILDEVIEEAEKTAEKRLSAYL